MARGTSLAQIDLPQDPIKVSLAGDLHTYHDILVGIAFVGESSQILEAKHVSHLLKQAVKCRDHLPFFPHFSHDLADLNTTNYRLQWVTG